MTVLKDAVVLVTGGQRGLGKAFVAELLERGAAKVYATARAPKPSGDPRVVPLSLEVTDAASVAALAKAAPDVSIIVNNAGIANAPGASFDRSLLSAPLSDVATLFDTNVSGPLRITQAFAPVLKRNGGGALVNILSAVSWAAGFGAYGATKAAFWSLTNSLRLELAAQKTQVVGVHLGFTDTDMIKGLNVPKGNPRDVARETLNVLEAGGNEVLADDTSRFFKSKVSGPVEGLTVAF